MTAERWALISSVFRTALERPAGDRAAYLDEACRGDALLRRSVEQLLAGEAEPSLASPAVKLLDAGAAGLAPGDTLAQYRVEACIGEGGMGSVYQAYDTRLQRKVALKVLRPDAFGDPDRRARLLREARAASALNHPNIVTIYEISSDGGVDFIALELVPGDTLARLLGRKPLPLREALKYAVQIANAVASAHRAGIVHRDLKPANILITPAGQVKVLDFGLAKWTGPAASEEPGSTATMGPLTDTGAIIGTPAYMSPEQAEGKNLDARSDIFSFGVVLYEMVNGKRAFERDSTAATLAAILKEEPRTAGALTPGLPSELDKILARCLRKDPERRFQHMDDLAVELNEVRETSESGVPELPGVVPPRRFRKLPWVAGLGLIVAFAGATAWLMRSRTPALEEAAVPVPLTSYPGTESTPSFSPDGAQVAFAWCKDEEENRCNIYIKQIGVEPPFRVTGNPLPEFSPAWSPDGRFIAFLRRLGGVKTALILIPQRGGRERVLFEFDLSSDSLEGPYLSWTPDAKWIALPQCEGRVCALILVSVETGEKRKLTSPPAAVGGMTGDTAPAFSPDGRTLAFARQFVRSDLYLLPLNPGYAARGEPAKVPSQNIWNTNAAWMPDGTELIFVSGTTTTSGLFRLPVGKPAKPRRLGFAPVDVSGPAISLQARRLAYSLVKLQVNIWRLDLGNSSGTPSAPVRFISSTKWDQVPAYSPTGTKIAFVSSRSGTPEIWVCESDGSNAVQLTAVGGDLPAFPHWSWDGRSIAFSMEQGERSDLYVISANGGPPRRLPTLPGGGKFPSFSPDGNWLYFASMDQQIWRVSTTGGPATQITKNEGDLPQVSPDGQFVYFQRNRADRISLWRISANGGDEVKILDSVHPFGRWTVGRMGVYFFTPPDERGQSEIHYYDFATGKAGKIQTIAARIRYGMALSPDGRTLLYSQIDDAGSDLMLVENFH